MKTIVITERNSNSVLLSRVLAEAVREDDYEVISAGGRSSAESLARTYLADGDSPVALVLNAGTTEDATVQDQELIVTESLRSAGPSQPYLVLLAKPEVEACLFEDRAVAGELFGKALSDEEWTYARYEPARMFRQLLLGANSTSWSPSELVGSLSAAAIQKVARGTLIQQLHDFIVGRSSLVATASPHA